MKIWYWALGELKSTTDFDTAEAADDAATEGGWGSVIGDTYTARSQFYGAIAQMEERAALLWKTSARKLPFGPSYQECQQWISRYRNWLARLDE